jgi:general secretion pathway protein C
MGVIGTRIANLVLFVLSCSVVANVVNQVGGAALIPNDPPRIAAPATVAPTGREWSEHAAILDRNLFGAQVVTEAIIEEVPEEDLQETGLPLRLLGTIASADQVVASAAIENTSNRKHEVVKVGDRLKSHSEVTVARIERGRVILDNAGRREELKLSDEIRPARAPRVAKRASRSRRSRSRAAKPPKPEPSARGGLDIDASALLKQARILPKYEDGVMVGIEISKIQPDSLYEQVGVQEGDVVMELNGVKIDSPAASKSLMDAIKEGQTLEMLVMGSDGESKMMKILPDQYSSVTRR